MSGLFISVHGVVLAGFAVLLAGILAMSRLPVNLVLRNIRPFLWLFTLTIIIHLVWTSGRILYHIPILNLDITYEGLQLGLRYTARLVLFILLATILTLSTSPIEMMDALERMGRPLQRWHVPVHELTLMLSLSLRFVPTLMEEAMRIRNAQLSRGAHFEGSLVKRIRSLVPMLLPLFISAFRRADELAYAMDARGYTGGDGRTCFTVLKFRLADGLAMGIVCGFFSLCVWI
jgi:energy-coupling factor transport system permease protein